jgi:hypothetical protein
VAGLGVGEAPKPPAGLTGPGPNAFPADRSFSSPALGTSVVKVIKIYFFVIDKLECFSQIFFSG